MNKYFLKINGKVLNEAYTYQEIEAKGLLSQNRDKVEVRASTESYYKPISNYNFPERSQTSKSKDYYIDEYGQMHRNFNSEIKTASSHSGSPSGSTSTYKPQKPSYPSPETSPREINGTSQKKSSSDDTIWIIITIAGIVMVGGLAGYFLGYMINGEAGLWDIIVGIIATVFIIFNLD